VASVANTVSTLMISFVRLAVAVRCTSSTPSECPVRLDEVQRADQMVIDVPKIRVPRFQPRLRADQSWWRTSRIEVATRRKLISARRRVKISTALGATAAHDPLFDRLDALFDAIQHGRCWSANQSKNDSSKRPGCDIFGSLSNFGRTARYDLLGRHAR